MPENAFVVIYITMFKNLSYILIRFCWGPYRYLS